MVDFVAHQRPLWSEWEFNSSTTMRYQLTDVSYVRLLVYDMLGREVATLVNEVKPPGVHSMQFDASGMASGVYFYRFQAGRYMSLRKMMVAK